MDSASRIVLLGATGYTGRLTADALVRRGLRPTLAGRDRHAVAELAHRLGDLPFAVADATDPASVRVLVGRGDVLVSTVGPFTRWGDAAAQAAIRAGAHYIDSTGEPAFVRRVFERWDEPARAAGITMLTAFGYDYVPGNLAAALALTEAGEGATTVKVGYFASGGMKLSGGTQASVASAMLEPSYAWSGGRLASEPMGRHLLRHRIAGGRDRRSMSVAGSEQLSLPRAFPQLREVQVGLGVTGALTPLAWLGGRSLQFWLRVPGVRPALRRLLARSVRGSTGGPSPEHNATATITVTAHAYDTAGDELSRVVLHGPSIYAFTAEALAWSAEQLATGKARASGALGPVEAFGLRDLTDGCASIGLRAEGSR